jgi:hypothetical protein
METDPVSEALFFSSYLEFRTMESPETQWFWLLYFCNDGVMIHVAAIWWRTLRGYSDAI